MGTRKRAAWMIAGVAVALSLAPVSAKALQICAPRKISATGATAQFAILGRVAARTAWTSKVAADPRLGSPYSTWLRSNDRRLICRKVDRRHICLAIAQPCRAASRTPAPAAALPNSAPNPKQRPL